MSQTTTTYDDVPYTSHPYVQSHPERLATIARLFGMSPPSCDKARILELGCAAGGNLIPLAQVYPNSTFLGVELSARQANEGQTTIQTVGLTNIQIRQASITDLTESEGQFDYILCHGVFSWVPPSVQNAILDICGRHLAPQGVAYISYNTLPGWHMFGMLRDMMLFHAKRFPEPKRRVAQARALLDFLDRWVPDKDNPFGLLLKKFSEDIRKKSDDYIYHEHLEDVNDPLYFHQFINRAMERRLQYLGEADLGVMAPDLFPAEVQSKLEELAPNILYMEQYMDFLRNRAFRQTLLCRADVQLLRKLGPTHLAPFSLASSVRPTVPITNVNTPDTVEFKVPAGAGINSNNALIKAALLVLGQAWPNALPFEQVYAEAWRMLGHTGTASLLTDIQRQAQPAIELGKLVYAGVTRRIIELHAQPVPCTAVPSERPRATPLARHQATLGTRVTNLRHESVTLNVFDQHTLTLLDGSRDRSALKEELLRMVRDGKLVARENDQVVSEADKQQLMVGVLLERGLQNLGRLALLQG